MKLLAWSVLYEYMKVLEGVEGMECDEKLVV